MAKKKNPLYLVSPIFPKLLVKIISNFENIGETKLGAGDGIITYFGFLEKISVHCIIYNIFFY